MLVHVVKSLEPLRHDNNALKSIWNSRCCDMWRASRIEHGIHRVKDALQLLLWILEPGQVRRGFAALDRCGPFVKGGHVEEKG